MYGSHDVSASRLARRRVMAYSALGREVRDFFANLAPALGILLQVVLRLVELE